MPPYIAPTIAAANIETSIENNKLRMIPQVTTLADDQSMDCNENKLYSFKQFNELSSDSDSESESEFQSDEPTQLQPTDPLTHPSTQLASNEDDEPPAASLEPTKF